ncbi:hypothetical protein D3C72_2302880 [compost metagenome]
MFRRGIAATQDFKRKPRAADRRVDFGFGVGGVARRQVMSQFECDFGFDAHDGGAAGDGARFGVGRV